MRAAIGFSLVLLQVLWGSVATARFEAQGLHLMAYKDLEFPPQLARDEVQWMLQSIADRLYGIAFVDLGDYTDLMHGHVVFRTAEGKGRPLHDLTDVEWQPDWASLKAIAILFHSQENIEERGGMPFTGPKGDLSSANRNWLLWLENTPWGRRGDFTLAQQEMPPQSDPATYTIRTDDLDPARFGENAGSWEYSFYFFRVSCETVQALQTRVELQKSNIVSVQVLNRPVCLALQSLHCRNQPNKDEAHCDKGLPLSPLERDSIGTMRLANLK